MKDIKKMTLGEIEEHRRESAEIEKALGFPAAQIGETLIDGKSPYQIGESYLIMTVTFFYVGRLVKEFTGELVLSEASWVADTGRYSDALIKGFFNEVEKIPESIIIPKSGIIAAVPWMHKLPTETK